VFPFFLDTHHAEKNDGTVNDVLVTLESKRSKRPTASKTTVTEGPKTGRSYLPQAFDGGEIVPKGRKRSARGKQQRCTYNNMLFQQIV